MLCPHCQTELPDPTPRFCDACGLAVAAPRRAPAAKPDAGEVIRCPDCGQPATGRRCRACGSRVRWPEDMTPPDEAKGG